MKRPFTNVAAVLLLVVALAHLWRVIAGAQVTIADAFIPMWVSYLGIVIPGGLAFMLWREVRK